MSDAKKMLAPCETLRQFILRDRTPGEQQALNMAILLRDGMVRAHADAQKRLVPSLPQADAKKDFDKAMPKGDQVAMAAQTMVDQTNSPDSKKRKNPRTFQPFRGGGRGGRGRKTGRRGQQYRQQQYNNYNNNGGYQQQQQQQQYQIPAAPAWPPPQAAQQGGGNQQPPRGRGRGNQWQGRARGRGK